MPHHDLNNVAFPFFSLSGSVKEKIFRQIGLQRVDEADPTDIVRLFGPDILVLVTSILVYVLCKRSSQTETFEVQGDEATSGRVKCKDYVYQAFIMAFLQSLGLVVAGLMVPCILNSVSNIVCSYDYVMLVFCLWTLRPGLKDA